jgi:hypothetical protein
VERNASISGVTRTLCLVFSVLLGCEAPPDGPLVPDSGAPRDSGMRRPDAAGGVTEVQAGPVSVDLCGVIEVLGSIEIPAGETVTICAGSTVTFAAESVVTVAGTLVLAGEESAGIVLQGDGGQWGGFDVQGTLTAGFVDMSGAEIAIFGNGGSTIRFDDSVINVPRGRQSARLANGGTFDRTRILGGDTLYVSGGMLSMTDSTLDLDHPGDSPDCLATNSGGVTLDHVRIANCHCPLHFNATSMPVSVTNSILEGAAYPVMIANTDATFHGNSFDGTAEDFQDIAVGGSNTIDADIAGNYYGGGPPGLDTDQVGQFRNAGDFLTEEPAGVGPR